MPGAFKISSIIIARNEEANIRRCIESQLGCIDEIILIVDSGTTDNTLEIAKSYAKVYAEMQEWKGYAGSKIYALSKTSNDWILWIDADEEITPELSDELNRFKNSVPAFAAYDLARKAFFLGKWIKHSGWYPGRVTRLFNKNSAGFSEDKGVHEHLVVNGMTGSLKNDLNHYTDPDINHYFLKFNNYTSLAAKDLQAKGRMAKLSDLLVRPLFLFLKMYIFRLGFLDGVHGFILAVFSSCYVFTKYAKLWELNNKAE